MKLLRYGEEGSERPGLLDGAGVLRDLGEVVADIDGAALGGGLLGRVAGLDPASLPAVEGAPRLAEPVARIGSFVCIGLNYSDHAREAGMAIPEEPVLFMKARTSITGPCDDVVLPPGSSKCDWEVELGVVIGRRASCCPLERAMDCVAGLCVVNDVSERAFQLERGGQWTKGKGCPTFGPVGPYLVTLDELADLRGLALWLELNGERMQDGHTRHMIFDVAYLVHYVSQFMALEPGDLISTGTPPGVGMGRRPPRWLQAGDEMVLGIDGLGVQRQRVISHPSAQGLS